MVEGRDSPARVEVTTGRSTRRIVIPSGYNLLENCEEVAADMTLLCAGAEGEALAEISDRGLSRRVAGASLQVTSAFFPLKS